MINKRRPYESPQSTADQGKVAVLQIDLPALGWLAEDEVTIMAGPILDLNSEIRWLVSKNGQQGDVIPSEHLRLQVYGYDGIEGLGQTPRPLSQADVHHPAVLLHDIMGTIFRAGDQVFIVEQLEGPGYFGVAHYILRELVAVHESSLCLVKYLPGTQNQAF